MSDEFINSVFCNNHVLKLMFSCRFDCCAAKKKSAYTEIRNMYIYIFFQFTRISFSAKYKTHKTQTLAQTGYNNINSGFCKQQLSTRRVVSAVVQQKFDSLCNKSSRLH